jgi:hypothetical protein
MCINVYGIEDKETRTGVEIDIVESAMDYCIGNIKMAFLNLFTAIDFYIEGIYDIAYHEYLNNYKSYSKIELNTIEKKVRDYANMNRRLVDEKLYDPWKELEIDSDCFKEARKTIMDLEKKRNKIAHGEAIVIEKKDYISLMLSFLDIIALFNGYNSFSDVLV